MKEICKDILSKDKNLPEQVLKRKEQLNKKIIG